MEFGIGCCCGGSVTIDWSRYLRFVGVVEPHAYLSGFAGEWTGFEAIAPVEAAGPPLLELKMKPVRYSLGSYIETAYSSQVSTKQQAIGPRSTAPPSTGHLKSSTLSQLLLPGMLMIWAQRGNQEQAGSLLRAVEVYKNGTSVGLFDFGTTYSMAHHQAGSVFYYTHNTITISLPTPLWLEPEDTLSFDYYLDLKASRIGSLSPTGDSGYYELASGFATPQSNSNQFNTPTTGVFSTTGSTTRLENTKRHKITFSDNGPGGITEFELKDQAGWASAGVPTGTEWTKNDSSYVITFGWRREIPFIQLFIPSLLLGFGARVRYRPVASGDYESIVFTGFEIEYGVWNPRVSTTFENRVIMENAASPVRWWSDQEIAPSYFSAFPASLSVVRI